MSLSVHADSLSRFGFLWLWLFLCCLGQAQPQLLRHQSSSNDLHLEDDKETDNAPTTTTTIATDCPCDDVSLCAPLSNVPPLQTPEVFGFIGCGGGGDNNGDADEPDPCTHHLNWTHITTIAWASNDQVMCEAHRHGVRAVLGSPPIANLTELALHPHLQDQYVATTVAQVVSTHRDGVTFDYEEPLARDSLEAKAYVSLIHRTKLALQQQQQQQDNNVHYQVTVCVAWSPDGIDGRDYPYKDLADVSDALYVMDYDTRSQINDDCIASANAPVGGMKQGIRRYLSLGIAAQQLILGVPWYGYRYPCLAHKMLSWQDRYCPIAPYDFRGSVCSDAVGSELPYLQILKRHAETESKTPIRRDANLDAAYYNALEYDHDNDKVVVVQYWFDDSTSTRHKYKWARSMGLAGVGPYRFDMVGYSYPKRFRRHAQDMWAALDAFVWPEPLRENESHEQSPHKRATIA